ncbi:acyl-CoA thioesterase/BAAT N-terminal domain-containing protein [Salicibibacter cibarius]|uniref:Acyl-CoA thioesterase/BAAT N-terminal domain-containing protein n=1 Tax=Salicibibacter cibarius TaxID=2743000 RepID=A0A7T6Z663_9BACI|nr:acyl-CoA thioesterase/bile acid-CoA:amino acid N-acyltransferase family protein [Salicibibacter cibarius]QQK77111.1 acyl-CoA thioesterase/BAAT N-terminal domain-containing protein [Salicibibacter cibarius]
MKERPAIIIDKLHSYIDEEIHIKVINCEPNEMITLKAKMLDDEGKNFESEATFQTNKDGVVSVSHDKPVKGSYNDIDSFGLFWSMEERHSKHGDFFDKQNASSVSVDLSLEISEKTLNTAKITRHFYREDIKKEVIKSNEFTAVLYHPAKEGTYPGVLLLGGSDGGYLESAAALLASYGYMVLSLAYFGTQNVPDNLERIPLEYFEKATQWLKKHPFVNQQVSVIGFSRGGELALLLGATYDEYKAVIAVSPSSYVTSGMKNSTFAPIPSWTFNGQDLPYMKFSYPPSMIFSTFFNWIFKRPSSFLSIWSRTMKDEKKIEDARIRVENIHASVLTISGSDDQLWPSEKFIKMMEKRLSNHHYQHKHLFYEAAGHFLAFPYSFPSIPSNIIMQLGKGMAINFGGTKSANARATIDGWGKIKEFLKQSMHE